jgi:hypothetical protein
VTVAAEAIIVAIEARRKNGAPWRAFQNRWVSCDKRSVPT